jgi:hypothetical protein
MGNKEILQNKCLSFHFSVVSKDLTPQILFLSLILTGQHHFNLIIL